MNGPRAPARRPVTFTQPLACRGSLYDGETDDDGASDAAAEDGTEASERLKAVFDQPVPGVPFSLTLVQQPGYALLLIYLVLPSSPSSSSSSSSISSSSSSSPQREARRPSNPQSQADAVPRRPAPAPVPRRTCTCTTPHPDYQPNEKDCHDCKQRKLDGKADPSDGRWYCGDCWTALEGVSAEDLSLRAASATPKPYDSAAVVATVVAADAGGRTTPTPADLDRPLSLVGFGDSDAEGRPASIYSAASSRPGSVYGGFTDAEEADGEGGSDDGNDGDDGRATPTPEDTCGRTTPTPSPTPSASSTARTRAVQWGRGAGGSKRG